MKKPTLPTKGILLRKPPFHFLAAVMIVAGAIGLGYSVTHSFAAGGAQLYLSPASGTYNTGSQVAVQVMVNTGTDPTNAVQADFSYPTSRLQFVSIDGTGSAYDIDASSSGGNGTVSIARGKIGTVTGTALIATVRFTVQGTAGSAALSFLGSSAVVRSTDNANVLGSTVGATYTVAVPATPTPTPVPTSTPAPTATPKTATPTPKTATPTPAPGTTPKPSSTSTPTPVVGGPAGSSTPSPAATTQSGAPTPAVVQTKTNSGKSAASPTLVKAATAGGSLFIIVLGFMLWIAAQRRRSLALVSSHGSSQPYPAPSVATPPAPLESSTPPANTTGPAPAQTFYPQNQGPKNDKPQQ